MFQRGQLGGLPAARLGAAVCVAAGLVWIAALGSGRGGVATRLGYGAKRPWTQTIGLGVPHFAAERKAGVGSPTLIAMSRVNAPAEMRAFGLAGIAEPGLVSAAKGGSAHGVDARLDQGRGRAQDTGFLNREVTVRGISYKFEVYVPEDWRRDDRKKWPVILALHGRGERGSEGMWQTQVGLAPAVRDHPERWPFVIVMPQCPYSHFWTDPEMQGLAMQSLEQEEKEFHGDPLRTYLTGLSLGGYGAWELAKDYPRRWAAIAIVAGGVFWSYAPERLREQATLPGEYARAIGRIPVWIFHGADDNVVLERQAELMFDALKAVGGHVKLWVYQGLKHDSWTRAYGEPELPRWLLAHTANAEGGAEQGLPAMAERAVVPLHPPAIKLPDAMLDSYAGEYRDAQGVGGITLLRQGDALYQRNGIGEITELLPEMPGVFFYATGGKTRLVFERDAAGRVTGVLFHDDRHEERWEKRR